MRIVIGKKQAKQDAQFDRVWADVPAYISRAEVDAFIEEAADEVRAMKRQYPNIAYGWSGGKDSLALQVVCARADVRPCVLSVIRDLEWPEYLEWCYVNAPGGDPRRGASDLVVRDNPTLTIDWLADHPDHLFPTTSTGTYWWVQKRTHYGQSGYYVDRQLDCIVYGRRKIDGNFIGPNGLHVNSDGIRQFCPMRAWPHEAVLGVIHYYGLPMPPTYFWPNGWTAGTGLWAGRGGFKQQEDGWRFTHSIDPVLTVRMAPRFASGRRFLEAAQIS